MGTFLHLYETEEQLNEIYNGSGYTEPWVSYTREITKVHYNKKPEPIDYSKMLLTFEILDTDEGDSIIVNANRQDRIEFKANDEDWCEPSDTGTGHYEILVQPGDVVQIRGDYENSDLLKFNETKCRFNVYGNILSTYNSTNFANITEIDDDSFTFDTFFQNCNVVSAEI